MSRLGTTAVTLLLLGAADALVTHRLEARHGRHVTRWASDTAWSEATGDETWHLWAARAADGAPRVVVHGPTSLAVWTLDGKRLVNGIIPWGTDVAVGDFDGDGQEEIAVAAEDVPPAAPVSIQVFDQAMNPVTPNVGLLESLEIPASVAIASFAGPRQVVAADFRGCLASLVGPDLAWNTASRIRRSVDPYAVRHLFPVTAGGGFVAGSHGRGGRHDAAGKRAYPSVSNAATVAVARLAGAERVFAGGDHGRTAARRATGQARARERCRHGHGGSPAAGGAVGDRGGGLGRTFDRADSWPWSAARDGAGGDARRRPGDGPAADFDGDGTDEPVAVTEPIGCSCSGRRERSSWKRPSRRRRARSWRSPRIPPDRAS